MKNATDLTGNTYGKLTVLGRVEDHIYPNGRHDIQYACKCECGKVLTVLAIHLRSGHTVSCGCYRAKIAKEQRLKHGMSNDRLYHIWKNMKARCYNEKHPDYQLYGRRGIGICKKWRKSFEAFRKWALKNGYSDQLSIDRIDVNRGYSPKNCRWATQKEQCNNTRRNIPVTINGETHTLKEWSEIKGIKYNTLHCRVQRGMSPIDAILKG